MHTLQLQKIDDCFRATIRDNDNVTHERDFADGMAAQEWGLEMLGEVAEKFDYRLTELKVRFGDMQ